MNDPARTAIVGAGLMGLWHARAARRAGAAIAGFVDPDLETAGTLARKFGGVAVASLPEVLDRADVVHVCSPLDTHVPLVRVALEGGKHVLCEKPLAATASEIEPLLDLADRRKVFLCPVHQYPFQRGVRRARTTLPTLGRLLHVDATACTAGADGLADPDRDMLAGEILPHPLSVIDTLTGGLGAAADWSARHLAAGEIRVEGRVGDASVGIVLSTRGRPTRNASRWICEKGTIHLDHFHGFAVVEPGAVSRGTKIRRPFAFATALGGTAALNLVARALAREPAFPGLESLVRAFYAAVKGEAPAPLNRRHILEVARSRDAILAPG